MSTGGSPALVPCLAFILRLPGLAGSGGLAADLRARLRDRAGMEAAGSRVRGWGKC
ncbi:exported hypothetical protein [Nitrolancea hollandica Lb]|uniref:Uncharacterized protein n=1 Tax=Nitrolancea hollandica Lb TaxID=1129897 RepID=I4EK70_9BACT|nr:exported hypothetical protein [Nitrolancea hollandica Lb]